MIGRTLSHYRVLDEISRGGMGVVYRASDIRLNRDVALKVLPDELVHDADRRRRFIHEAQAASALEHPNIAVIHEVDEAEGVTFIAMELVRGEKLRDLIERRRLSPPRALELLTEIAEGLARAHEKGVVHRDIKPANVMVTDEGHAKIIDFGLAKLIERPGGLLDADHLTREGTEAGVVLGTVTYMSPEQASGDRVDHRSDIFSFGVLAYEMLAGKVPHEGRTSIDVLHAILNQPPPRLPALGGASPEAASALQRLVDKCLAKDPADRYQGMRDIVVDLRAARRLLESGTSSAGASSIAPMVPQATGLESAIGAAPSAAYAVVAPDTSASRASDVTPPVVPASRRRTSLIAVATAIVVGIAIGVTVYVRRAPQLPPQSGRPSVAVMYFENNTGNQGLDWLRTGLTDMVVTDLSQSPDIEVLSTDRLYQILADLKRADDRIISADVVQEVARRAGIRTVILGSYVKAGDVIRINVKLQEAGTGRIVSSDRVDAPDESKLFAMVDELTRRIKSTFKLPGAGDTTLTALLPRPGSPAPAPPSVFDRGLTEVTTSSIEAYRYYVEAMNLHQRYKEAEAVPLLEKAVELDPKFATALARLSIIHGNLFHVRESVNYARRALENSANLPPRERLYIEGVNYYRRPETIEKAFDAYKKLIELYPDHDIARQNLAVAAVALERDDVAVEQAEELRRRGMTFPGTYSVLANAYARRGDFDKGVAVWREYMQRFPDNARAQVSLGGLLVAWGKFDEALAAYEKARALGAPDRDVLVGPISIAIQRDDFPRADALAQKETALSDAADKFEGWYLRGFVAWYQGRTREGLDFLRESLRVAPPGMGFDAMLPAVEAGFALDRNDAPRALALLEKARAAFKSDTGAPFPGLPMLAVAQVRTGRSAQADETLKTIQERADSLPLSGSKRGALLAAGEVARARGDLARAITLLTQAQASLRPRVLGVGTGPPSQHVTIWYALGEAHLAAGDRREAAEAFGKIVEGGVARVSSPMQFVRSLYFLGQIAEQQGDQTKAREYYRRFVGYWKDGDLDRDRVAAALKKIG